MKIFYSFSILLIAFLVRFVYAGHSDFARSKKGKLALGIDYFLIENDTYH